MISANKIFILIVIIVLPAFAQEYLDGQMAKGRDLYLKGEYFDAITQMKRLLFFDKGKKYTYEANELIGECYKTGAKFTDAIIYFSKARSLNTREERNNKFCSSLILSFHDCLVY